MAITEGTGAVIPTRTTTTSTIPPGWRPPRRKKPEEEQQTVPPGWTAPLAQVRPQMQTQPDLNPLTQWGRSLAQRAGNLAPRQAPQLQRAPTQPLQLPQPATPWSNYMSYLQGLIRPQAQYNAPIGPTQAGGNLPARSLIGRRQPLGSYIQYTAPIGPTRTGAPLPSRPATINQAQYAPWDALSMGGPVVAGGYHGHGSAETNPYYDAIYGQLPPPTDTGGGGGYGYGRGRRVKYTPPTYSKRAGNGYQPPRRGPGQANWEIG